MKCPWGMAQVFHSPHLPFFLYWCPSDCLARNQKLWWYWGIMHKRQEMKLIHSFFVVNLHFGSAFPTTQVCKNTSRLCACVWEYKCNTYVYAYLQNWNHMHRIMCVVFLLTLLWLFSMVFSLSRHTIFKERSVYHGTYHLREYLSWIRFGLL